MPISAVGRFFLHIQNGINRKSHASCSEKKKAGGEKGRRLREKREEGFSYGVLQEPRQPS